MQPIVLRPFSGIAPKIAPRLLPDGWAQIAENCKLFSGELDVWMAPGKVATASKGAGVKSIFRMTKDDGTDLWLNWLEEVDAVRGPIAGDTTQRTYYTGHYEPRVTNLSLADVGGDVPYSWYVLGVYPPQAKPTMSVAGGSAPTVARQAVYTFVTEWGEESQPSPVSDSVTGNADGTWTVAGMDATPPNTFAVTSGTWAGGVATVGVANNFGLRVGETVNVTGATPSGFNAQRAKITDLSAGFISYALPNNPGAYSSGGSVARDAPHHTNGLKKRIYWTFTAGGATVFQFVKEIDASLTTVDIAGNVTPGEPIASAEYEMPPVDMAGITELPNGMMAAFSGNDLCFCEPFKPHAWPTIYKLATNRPIVGLAASGSSVVVATKGTPYVATGATPDSMSMQKVDVKLPCMSKRSVVGMRDGVKYATNDGIVIVGQGGSGIASAAVMTRKEMSAYYPSTIFATAFQERYFGWYVNADSVTKGFIFDTTGTSPILVPFSVRASAVWTDPETGDLFLVIDGNICKWDSDTLNNLTYDWKSKVMVQARPSNYTVAKVDADYSGLVTPEPPATSDNAAYTANVALMALSETWPRQGKTSGCMNESMMDYFAIEGSLLQNGAVKAGDQQIVDQRFLNFQLYAGGELRYTKSCTNAKPFRLPGGFAETDFEIRLTGNIPTRRVEMAASVSTLGRIA
jgi:hypothetical protein